MAKKVTGFIKLQVPAGAANPAPPVGPALGQHGVNIMEFCKQFNARTQGQPGMIIPVEITVYADRSFTFITKTPPAPVLLKKAAGLDKGSASSKKEKVGKVTRDQLRQMEEGAEKPKLKSTFQKGDKVRVIEGPFVNFQGSIDDLNPERGKLKVMVAIFGRMTPVELEYYQVERL